MAKFGHLGTGSGKSASSEEGYFQSGFLKKT